MCSKLICLGEIINSRGHVRLSVAHDPISRHNLLNGECMTVLCLYWVIGKLAFCAYTVINMTSFNVLPPRWSPVQTSYTLIYERNHYTNTRSMERLFVPFWTHFYVMQDRTWFAISAPIVEHHFRTNNLSRRTVFWPPPNKRVNRCLLKAIHSPRNLSIVFFFIFPTTHKGYLKYICFVL